MRRCATLPLFVLLLAGTASAGDYASLRIVAPEHDAMVYDNSGEVSVTLALAPPLDERAGDRLVLLLDGAPVARGTALHIPLTAIDRGTHTLQAQVMSRDGTVLIASPPTEFHLWRASRLLPGRKARPDF